MLFHIYLYKYNPSTSFSQKGKERDRSLGPNCARVDADARGRRLNVTLTILKTHATVNAPISTAMSKVTPTLYPCSEPRAREFNERASGTVS